MNKSKTRKNKIICYTGIGAQEDGIHTKKKFMNIARKEYTSDFCKTMKSSKSNKCPTTLKGWVKYFGAMYISPEKCAKIIKKNKNMV